MNYVYAVFILMLIIGVIIYCITGFLCFIFKKDNNPVSPFKVFCAVDFIIALVLGLTGLVIWQLGSTIGDALLAALLIIYCEPAMVILFIGSMIFGYADKYKSKKRQRFIEEKSRMLSEKHNANKNSANGESTFDEEMYNDNQVHNLINQIEFGINTEDE